MAKSTGGLGQFRGKMGSAVFSVRNGQQIVRAYQPVVTNPKSSDQRIQRAKAVLVGQLSNLIQPEIIVGFSGGSKSARRSKFLSALFTAVTAEIAITTGTAKAILNGPELVLSEGNPTQFVIPSTPALQNDAGQVVLSWTNIADLPSGMRYRIIGLMYLNIAGTDKYVWKVFDQVVNASERMVTIGTFASGNYTLSSSDFNFYVIPIYIDESVLALQGAPLVGSIGNDQGKDAYTAELVARNSSAVSYGKSQWMLSESNLND